MTLTPVRPRHAVALCLGAAALAAFVPDARACTPPADGVGQSVPGAGETYPASAAVLFWGNAGADGQDRPLAVGALLAAAIPVLRRRRGRERRRATPATGR